MQFGRVVGQAVATLKHASMVSQRLLVVQPLTSDGGADGEPVLAVDDLGAGRGGLVILCNEGQALREMLGAKDSPVRWFVLGLCD